MLSAATRAGASAAAASLLPRKSAGLGDAGGEQLATSYTPASRVPSDSASISQVFFSFYSDYLFVYLFFYLFIYLFTDSGIVSQSDLDDSVQDLEISGQSRDDRDEPDKQGTKPDATRNDGVDAPAAGVGEKEQLGQSNDDFSLTLSDDTAVHGDEVQNDRQVQKSAEFDGLGDQGDQGGVAVAPPLFSDPSGPRDTGRKQLETGGGRGRGGEEEEEQEQEELRKPRSNPRPLAPQSQATQASTAEEKGQAAAGAEMWVEEESRQVKAGVHTLVLAHPHVLLM